MLDLVIRGGTVIDGSGTPGFSADIGVVDGRITKIGKFSERGRREIRANGRVVAPGFIDVHTHYDAQVLWDPALTPSPLHGVTTVVLGNCGLTLAPIDDRNIDYTLRMLSRVEGMSPDSLQHGVPWGTWHSFSEYLHAIERPYGRLTLNVAVLVGHNALRLTVMGSDMRREATPSEIEEMVALLEEALRQGGIGFSTSYTDFHSDGEGHPIPSRYSAEAELLALATAVGRQPGTTLQITGGLGAFGDREMSLMTKMSLAADRPINWNSMMVSSQAWGVVQHNLTASDYAAERGASVLALTFAVAPTTRLSFVSGVLLDTLPGWSPIFAEPDLTRRADMLRGQEARSHLAAGAAQAEAMAAYTAWGTHTVDQAYSEQTASLVGRRIGDVAIERNQSAFDCMLDIVLADDLRTVILTKPNGDDRESWRLRSQVFSDPRVLIGASDAGAHVDMIDAFAYTTDLLGPSVRERHLFPLEEAVRLITDVPARVYGFSGRGQVAVGNHADLVVFDPDDVGHGQIHMRKDLPGGASRLFMAARGIDHVFVAGKEVVRGQELTGTTGGKVLRSGTDTDTVHSSYLPQRIIGRESEERGMRGAQVRSEVGHPIIDADGHFLEFMPAILPYVRETLSASNFDRYAHGVGLTKAGMLGPGLAERRRSRQPQGGWWASPVKNVQDLATSLAPRLLHERLPELGFDYAVLYPSYALGAAGVAEEEFRIGLCRGLNDYLADVYGPFADRYAVAGLIPMHTPDEALAELEHCKKIGLKVAAIHTGVLRPIVSPAPSPWLMPNQTDWWDHFGLDSLYDYDPVWERFAELGFAVTVHWGVGGPPTTESNYNSITNWMANHIGSFAGPTAQTVKSLYLGGVTRRLPHVVFAFQEGGVGWAPGLLGDTIEHWEKRNLPNLRAVYDPELLDLDRLISLMQAYAPELVGTYSESELRAILPSCTLDGDPPEDLDEWRVMAIETKQDLVDLFSTNFYFGCEADDRGVAAAFSSTNPGGANFKPMIGSDISHFDVPDFERVLGDAYGMVETGLITADQFRRFSFENVAEMLLRANPTFFKGTAIEGQMRGVIGAQT